MSREAVQITLTEALGALAGSFGRTSGLLGGAVLGTGNCLLTVQPCVALPSPELVIGDPSAEAKTNLPLSLMLRIFDLFSCCWKILERESVFNSAKARFSAAPGDFAIKSGLHLCCRCCIWLSLKTRGTFSHQVDTCIATVSQSPSMTRSKKSRSRLRA